MTQHPGDTLLENVSRETYDRLRLYEALLLKWNSAINLVSRHSLAEVWQRHFVDSAQLLKFLPIGCSSWADLGSGGGFPGLVVAILAAEVSPTTTFTLVESDQRKATFLRQVCRETGIGATVLTDRIEQTPPLNAAVVSARALAPLSLLCQYAARHGAVGSLAVFQKGATFEDELTEARRNWLFDCEPHQSQTDTSAIVLAIRNIRPVIST